MAWGRNDESYAYAYGMNAVYDALFRAAEAVKYKLKKSDRVAYKAQFSTGISLFTWGEQLHVSLAPLPDGRTGVYISSISNLGTEIAASSRNRKNVEKFVKALNTFLPPR